MIDLTDIEPFASGSNRVCFVHPDDPATCLKVLIPENIERRFQRQSAFKKLLGRQRLNDNRQEAAAYAQAAIRRAIDDGNESMIARHLPRFYGVRMTSLGAANASELIRLADGSPATTLESYLQQAGRTPALEAAIERFSEWLLTVGILTRNLLPHNLVLTDRSGQLELILVDGLGAPTVQAALAGNPAWRQRYIQRKLRRMQLRIDWELGNRKISWEAAQKL